MFGIRAVESWGQEDGGTVSLPSTRMGQEGGRGAERANALQSDDKTLLSELKQEVVFSGEGRTWAPEKKKGLITRELRG